MPIAQQFLVRALGAGPGDIVQGASLGALSHALGGGSMGSSMEAARSAAGHAVDGIRQDLAGFSCGALRVAISFAVGADASLAWTAGIWGACAPLFGIATYVAYRDIFLHRADNVPARVRVRTWHAAPLGAV